MKKTLFLSILFVLTVLVAAGCAQGAPTEPPPTSTPIVYPATFTPGAITPTVTSTPTATGIPPTRTPNADTQKVMAAFVRTAKLRAYQVNMTISAIDPTGSIPGSKPNEALTLLGFVGRINQADSQWQFTGEFVKDIGADPVKGITFVTLGDTVYLQGPATKFGATEARWYQTPLSAESMQDAFPQYYLDKLASAAASFPTMRSVGTEPLDNKSCTKYQGDENETRVFSRVLAGGIAPTDTTQDNGARDTLTIWVCDDAYVHQLEWSYQIPAGKAQGQYGTFTISMHLSELRILVPINAPPDSIPLPNPLTLPTPYAAPIAAPTTTS